MPFDLNLLLQQRGITDPVGFLASRESLDRFRRPVEVLAMQAAVNRIRQAVEYQQTVGLYGDYDCDGVTSAAILYRYLSRGLGLEVITRLPDRFRDGYGVHARAIEQFADQGCELVLTCDNGITAMIAAQKAREIGIDLIVTDHHLPGKTLPDVLALVHPSQGFEEFRDLCGAGVAFLLVIALEGGLTPRLESFLDLVAMGTVADVVPLDGPNRPLVWHGLQRMRRGQAHVGTRALAEAAGTHLPTITARDLAFSLCPRLNAAGRLELADAGFDLLVTNDRGKARLLADDLDRLNQERRQLSRDLDLQALIQTKGFDPQETPFLVLANETFHAGINGLVSGRLTERLGIPTLVLSPETDGSWRGSGRSPVGFSLYEALLACQDHLVAFGGHARAAGCRVMDAGLPALNDALVRYTQQAGWSPAKLPPPDARIGLWDVTEQLLDELDRLEPTGQGNPAPIFAVTAQVVERKIRKGHLFLTLGDADTALGAVAWNQAKVKASKGEVVTIHGRPERHVWRETREIRLACDRIRKES